MNGKCLLICRVHAGESNFRVVCNWLKFDEWIFGKSVDVFFRVYFKKSIRKGTTAFRNINFGNN